MVKLISKQFRRTKFKIKKYKKTKHKNNSQRGGMNKLIGHGTHGKIYQINTFTVIKEFANRPQKQNCICLKIKDDCQSVCDHIHYEYLIQELIYNSVNEQNDIKIKIPKPQHFRLSNDKTMCHYEMDYIQPCMNSSSVKNTLIQIDMGSPNKDELTQGVGHFLGYARLDLTNCTISRVEELAYQIGLLFSYLHYVLHIDGFDCELVLGYLAGDSDNDSNHKCDVFLIDFDKVSCFEFKLGFVAYRKLDESTIETKTLNTVKRFAWFLFSGITGMSLLPSDPVLKSYFLEGYARYINLAHTEQIVIDVYNEVVQFINDYGS